MSSSKPSHYKLTPQALTDLDNIWRYTAETWSIEQADSYIDSLTQCLDTLVIMPSMAREYHEFDPPVRIHTFKEHLIVYLVTNDHLTIVRLLGGSQNWRAILDAVRN